MRNKNHLDHHQDQQGGKHKKHEIKEDNMRKTGRSRRKPMGGHKHQRS